MKKGVYLYQVIDQNKKMAKIWVERKTGSMQNLIQSVATNKNLGEIIQSFELCQYCESPLMIDEHILCADCRHKVK
jgi:hypothetical protein